MILAAFVVGGGPQGTPPLGPLVFSDVVTGGTMLLAVVLATEPHSLRFDSVMVAGDFLHSGLCLGRWSSSRAHD